MNQYGLKIRCIRILPWDIGGDLTIKKRIEIEKLLIKSGWRFRKIKKYVKDEHPVGYLKYKDRIITLVLFPDGYSVFSVHENTKRIDSELDFDPVSLTSDKTESHKKFLSGTHELSNLLRNTIIAVWKNTKFKNKRNSANINWENGGFSYVFTFFLIHMSPMNFRIPGFKEKISALMFPIPVEEATTSPLMDQTFTILEHSSTNIKRLEDIAIADFPYRKIYFSWTTSLVIGEIPISTFLTYCNTMRDLQHAWFSAYVTDRNLDSMICNLRNINSINKLINLDSSISIVSRDVSYFITIPDSMATNITLRTYKVASRESGLDSLSQSINSKLMHIRNEITARIQKRNYRGSKKVEIILLVLTFIQAISAYKSLASNVSTTSNEILFFCCLFLLLLILVFIR